MGKYKVNKGSCNHYVESPRTFRECFFEYQRSNGLKRLDVIIDDIADKVMGELLKYLEKEVVEMVKGKGKKKMGKKC